MILGESRRGRRLIGRLGRGQDLMAALARAASERGVRSGEVRAQGSFESCEVAEYDQAAKAWKPARRLGPVQVVSLTGTLSESGGQLKLDAHVVLMRDRDSGVEVVGGHLERARVFSVEYVIDAWDDVIVRRGVEGETGLAVWREAVEMPVGGGGGGGDGDGDGNKTGPGPGPRLGLGDGDGDGDGGAGAGLSWAEVARASRQVEEVETVGADIEVRVGDVIEHPKFGRVTVERLEGEHEFAHVRLRNARLVRLSLEVLRLSVASDGPPRVLRASVG